MTKLIWMYSITDLENTTGHLALAYSYYFITPAQASSKRLAILF